ncbi:GNAT family N-acetyltransferase [Orbus mooreae]|uniref:GNAT family N-acetyltransferase n=1 Tax=Orbus mooreae TaxID=3074107 RepID=UPI00370DA7E9
MKSGNFLLAEKSLFKRVEEEKKHRESQEVDIINYQPIYQHIFQSLNEAWISRYFEMEEADHKVLADPQQSIIKNGGYIFVVLYKQEPVGVYALLKMSDPDYDYELVKMAVSSTAQGKNIGFLLGQAAIKKALELGANKLYLESNTMLKPAINLYQKLGFKKVVRNYTPYQRCNIQMELSLKK